MEHRTPDAFDHIVAMTPARRAARWENRDISFLDVKGLNDMAADNRARLRDLLAAYRSAKQVFRKTDSAVVMRIYASHDMAFLRHEIGEARVLDVVLRADARLMTDEYLRRLKAGSWAHDDAAPRKAA